MNTDFYAIVDEEKAVVQLNNPSHQGTSAVFSSKEHAQNALDKSAENTEGLSVMKVSVTAPRLALWKSKK